MVLLNLFFDHVVRFLLVGQHQFHQFHFAVLQVLGDHTFRIFRGLLEVVILRLAGTSISDKVSGL